LDHVIINKIVFLFHDWFDFVLSSDYHVVSEFWPNFACILKKIEWRTERWNL